MLFLFVCLFVFSLWGCAECDHAQCTNTAFQLRLLAGAALSLRGAAKVSLSVWNVTTNKLILLMLMDIVQVGNNTIIDWLVFALEHTDLSKIIVNNPTGSQISFVRLSRSGREDGRLQSICFFNGDGSNDCNLKRWYSKWSIHGEIIIFVCISPQLDGAFQLFEYPTRYFAVSVHSHRSRGLIFESSRRPSLVKKGLL